MAPRAPARKNNTAQRQAIMRAANQARADLKIIANSQSVGKTVARPVSFGGGRKKAGRRRRPTSWFDATSTAHLPLPRAVAPYAVIRLTKNISIGGSITERMCLLGTCVSDALGATGRESVWTNTCCVSNNNVASSMTQPINGTSNASLHTLPYGGLASASTLVPSAFTVQVMNPQALQTTSGVVYMGRWNTQLALSNETRSWNTLKEEFISYQSPRVLSAGKLAMAGVKCNCTPANMAELANFRPYYARGDGAVTWNSSTSGDFDFAGFNCIAIIIPQGLTLELLITVEYRVRFDPGNPAVAAHTHHKPASEQTWAQEIESAAEGAGVYEIASRAVGALL
jgi:hypothetical protein